MISFPASERERLTARLSSSRFLKQEIPFFFKALGNVCDGCLAETCDF